MVADKNIACVTVRITSPLRNPRALENAMAVSLAEKEITFRRTEWDEGVPLEPNDIRFSATKHGSASYADLCMTQEIVKNALRTVVSALGVPVSVKLSAYGLRC